MTRPSVAQLAVALSLFSIGADAAAQEQVADAASSGNGSEPSRAPPRQSRAHPQPVMHRAYRADDPWYSSGLFGTDPREPVYLPVGLLLSWPFERSLGIGGEASLAVYHQRQFHWGLVAQAQYELDAGGDHGRFALGPQFGMDGFGVEIAAALRTRNSEHATSLALHLAPYVSAAFVSIALRLTSGGLAIDDSELGTWPAELALAFTVKWPVRLQSDLYCSASADRCQPGMPRPPP